MSTRFDRLALLKTFVRIAERGNLSGAARDLETSQPSVSRQLAALEARLGTVLARRTTHDVTLTPDGLTLLADARRMLAEWEAIEERHQQEEALSGTLRVIAPIALGQSLLMGPAAKFLKEHPDVQVEWKLRDGDLRFAEEGCDVWIKVGPVKDDTLIVRELGKVERLVVGAPSCVDEGHRTKVEELPWVTLGPFEGNRIELFDSRGGSHQFEVHPRLASDNIFAVSQAVREGVGVAIMPSWFVANELESGALIEVLPDFRAPRLSVSLAIASGTKRPRRVTSFCDAMEAWAAATLVGS
ncbi:MAG: LysR family transcriptional regulator [Pseudomonadota bacterium]